MPRNAIGLIEVVGMAAALAAADAAVKSANVQLLGYENSKGGGMITIKFEGDVGAVKAALDAASVEAGKVNRVVSKHFIPRPSDELEKIIPKKKAPPEKKEATQVEVEEEPIENIEELQELAETSEEVEETQEIVEASQEVEEPQEIVEASQEVEETPSIEIASNEEEEEESYGSDKEETESDNSPQVTSDQEVCNICRDPACTRRKGEVRTMCIHYHATVGGGK